ncbi:pentapeptide repeat-containing protein [Acinetobacter baumannii]|uniref:pentapeptide repeat-containing protein n=1 Tax=Acinetobacter baumannii TaxID=470 RepID=UPI0012986413|nr:pentapeptide repeat-containing protein [Acinetobacter baumannii]MQZ18440.1 pentapeptide repeat-containing protein [Acinetobacter baumannii]MQZ22632.1 pentapeptide repeat-containing protein [Acinetobacter baumannii]MQZ41539.1 pentapeptide repeat-containing protein [Acinetobacter baumannii]MQZ68074.1 pentapeptide repeat-containing protein [Acinetobacter baumannii]MQZ84172.1 pentapeptide repeat-containing protein [Acinetobacter baumannii]
MTQKFEIKNRWTKEVLFTCDIPEGMESGMIARHAVEAAIAADADLRGADLYGADLRGANLRGADLYGADLRGAKAAPLFVYGLCWDVIISGLGKMRIGCQEHSVADWKSFDDARITRMDSEALEFWNQHKLMLLNMCDSYVHPVEETSNDSE